MKMIWCGLKIIENCHVLVNQFHGNFRSKKFCCRKIKSVFRDVKWCFNASWGLKGLTWCYVFFRPSSTAGLYSGCLVPTAIIMSTIAHQSWQHGNTYLHIVNPSPTTLFYLNFTHLKLCLATATHNIQVDGNYSYLINLRPNICKSWCLNTHFIPDNWFNLVIKQIKNNYCRN